MSLINQFRKGEMTRAELMALARSDPAYRQEIEAALDIELSDDDLYDIAAAGSEVPGGKDDDNE